VSANTKPLPSDRSQRDERHASGAQRIDLTASATRMSPRFQIPREALRSEPPEGANLPRTYSEAPETIEETAQVSVPESLKVLSVRTPGPIRTADLAAELALATAAIPRNPVPELAPTAEPRASAPDVVASAASALVTTTSTRSFRHVPRRRRSRLREIASALALFTLLLVASAVASRVIIGFFFAD
jgi:hypothetical protein